MHEAIKGLILAVVWWVLAIFIAFNIFSVADEHTVLILLSTLAVSIFGAKYLLDNRKITKQTLLWYLIWFIVLIGLYYLPINSNIPNETLILNKQISEANLNKFDYAEELFFKIEKNWTSPTRQYLKEPAKTFFIKDYKTFWFTKGYVPSNIQAQMYHQLLIRSGRFNPNEVELVNDFCANSPHGLIYFKEKNDYADFWAVDQFPSEYKFGDRTVYPCNKLLLILNLVI